MNGRVIIVGANQASLTLAEFLGKGGLDVCVYEKEKRENVSYDWHDDMHPSVFEKVGIPMPDSSIYFPKGDWSFVSPDAGSITRIYQDKEKVDLSVERRKLNDYLYNRAKQYVQFYYETPVTRVTTDANRVTGVELYDGTIISADLVVDVSGAESVCRASLPESLRIQRRTNKGDLFKAYRAFVNRVAGVPAPELHTNKAYLKHLGEAGISWCIWDKPSDTVNVLVGRIDELKKTDFERAYKALRDDNPIIGDEIVRGGRMCTIPVRRPISKMVADGYALVGDSAFMTIPMLGSGMASGIVASRMLADVILQPEGDPFSVENLYQYQVRFMREMGARFSGVEMMKNWLLSAPSDKVAFLFNAGVLSEEDLKVSCVGELIKLTPVSMVKKAVKGRKELPLLIQMSMLLMKINKQIKIAENIPDKYDEDKFIEWQKKYSKAFSTEI